MAPSFLSAFARPLRHRNFRLFASGQIISLIGTWVQNVSEAWLVYRLTGSSAALGLVRFAGLAPVFVLALVGGDWADRANRRHILIGTQTAAMVLAFVLAVLCFTDRVQVWIIVLLAALLGVVNAIDNPTRQSFVVEMVGKEDLPSAIGFNSSMFHLARILGPTAAGILLATVGEAWCFTINGLSFVAVIVSLILMRLPQIPRPAPQGHIWARIRTGVAYAWTTPPIRSLLVLVAVISLFGSSFLVLMPVVAKEVLGQGADGYSLLMTAAGLGSLAGAVTLTLRKTAGLWSLRATASLGFGLTLILFALSRTFWLSALLAVPCGLFMILLMATSNTLVQTLTPDELRGRVMALFAMMFMGMSPFGSLGAGLLAEHLGVGSTLVLCGTVCLSAGLLLGFRKPAI
ncbi:MAG: MFS transporter [Desulfovibrionales bacterium]|nr:MFS transporter [Desulfovibrionales bacterium]